MPVVEELDDETDTTPQRDEYGEIFVDYGFLQRAESSRSAGNESFKKERYELALSQYDEALESLRTVAYDKTITIGKRKWNDVVVLRSTIHLNKSTCHYKLKQWQHSLDEAMECLVGNVRDEMLFTDPHVRQKVKESERKHGHLGVTYVEHRLPRTSRAKAWFRVSQCNAHLDYVDRAKDALAKALEMADDTSLLAEISQHSLRLDTLERLQRDKQKTQFRGFWDKLQDRGGYKEAKPKKKDEWDTINYSERFKYAEAEAQDTILPMVFPAFEETQTHEQRQKAFNDDLLQKLPPGAKLDSTMKVLTKNTNKHLEQSFERYLSSKKDEGPTSRSVSPGFGKLPPPPKEHIPPRPRRSEEARISYSPRGGRPDDRTRTARSPSPVAFNPAEAYARYQAQGAQKHKEWRDMTAAQEMDDDEKLELQQARERMALQRWERLHKQKYKELEALDDSDGE